MVFVNKNEYFVLNKKKKKIRTDRKYKQIYYLRALFSQWFLSFEKGFNLSALLFGVTSSLKFCAPAVVKFSLWVHWIMPKWGVKVPPTPLER